MTITAVVILVKTSAGPVGAGFIIIYLGLVFVVWQGGRTRNKRQVSLTRTNQELARSNADLEQFAYAASHDLRVDPLTMITGYTQLLADRYKGQLDTEADKYLTHGVDGSVRMGALIDDLLEYPHIGTTEDAHKETGFNAVVKNATANLTGVIKGSDAAVTCDNRPTGMANESQIVQVFQNIIGNAIKYRNESAPEIHIAVTKI